MIGLGLGMLTGSPFGWLTFAMAPTWWRGVLWGGWDVIGIIFVWLGVRSRRWRR